MWVCVSGFVHVNKVPPEAKSKLNLILGAGLQSVWAAQVDVGKWAWVLWKRSICSYHRATPPVSWTLIIRVAGHVTSSTGQPYLLHSRDTQVTLVSLCWTVFNMLLFPGSDLSLSRNQSLPPLTVPYNLTYRVAVQRSVTLRDILFCLLPTGQEKFIGDPVTCHW